MTFSKLLHLHRHTSSSSTFSDSLHSNQFLTSSLTNVLTLEGHRGCINTCSFNPDGNLQLTGCDDGSVWLWDIGSRLTTPIAMFSPHKTNVFTTNFLTANRFISGGNDATVQVIELLPDGSARATTYPRHHIRKVHSSFVIDDHTFVTCSYDRTVRLFDTRVSYRNQNVRPLPLLTAEDFQYNPSEKLVSDLYSNHLRNQANGGGSLHRVSRSSIDSESLLLDVGDRAQLCQIDVHPIDRKQFLTAGMDGSVRLFDMRMIRRNSPGNLGFDFTPRYGGAAVASGASFDDSGARIAVSIFNGKIHIIDAAMAEELPRESAPLPVMQGGRARPRVRGHLLELSEHRSEETIKTVNWIGDFVVTGSDDGTVFLYDSQSGKVVNILEGHEATVNVVAVHREKKLLATSGIDNFAILWEPREIARVKLNEVREKVGVIREEQRQDLRCPVM